MDNNKSIERTIAIIEDCKNIEPPSPIQTPLSEQPSFKRQIKRLKRENATARKRIGGNKKQNTQQQSDNDTIIVTALKDIFGKYNK